MFVREKNKTGMMMTKRHLIEELGFKRQDLDFIECGADGEQKKNGEYFTASVVGACGYQDQCRSYCYNHLSPLSPRFLRNIFFQFP